MSNCVLISNESRNWLLDLLGSVYYSRVKIHSNRTKHLIRLFKLGIIEGKTDAEDIHVGNCD